MTTLRFFAALSCLFAIPGGSWAQTMDNGEQLVDLFGRWSDRAVAELVLDGAPGPSRALVAGWDGASYTLHAGFGAVMDEDLSLDRPALVEVVVSGGSGA